MSTAHAERYPSLDAHFPNFFIILRKRRTFLKPIFQEFAPAPLLARPHMGYPSCGADQISTSVQNSSKNLLKTSKKKLSPVMEMSYELIMNLFYLLAQVIWTPDLKSIYASNTTHAFSRSKAMSSATGLREVGTEESPCLSVNFELNAYSPSNITDRQQARS